MGATTEVVSSEQAAGAPTSPQRESYEVVHLPPSQLVDNDLNAETFLGLAPGNYAALKADIEKRGIVCPLVANSKRVLLAGHQRLQIARDLHRETVPVIVRDDLDDDAQRELLLLDNLTGRQLSVMELSNVAVQLWKLYEGRRLGRPGKDGGAQVTGKTRDLVAQRMGFGGKTVDDLRKFQALSPGDRGRLHSGEISKTEALRILRRQQGGQTETDASKAFVEAARNISKLTARVQGLVAADPEGDGVRPRDARQLRENVGELAK